jgi:hypothetical protein
MPKTDLHKVTFTPVLDTLTDNYGLITSAVFGRIWRYCQMDKGYCHAEQTRIAEQLGITRETVNRAIKVLVSGGYIEDSTPNTKGRTRIYKDTGKAGLAMYFEPVSVPVSEVVSEPVRLSHTKIVKTEKKEKTLHTESSVVLSFLENASQEQRTAYQLVRKVSGESKSIEVASRDYPLQAAYDYIEYLSERGNRAASQVIEENLYDFNPAMIGSQNYKEDMKERLFKGLKAAGEDDAYIDALMNGTLSDTLPRTEAGQAAMDKWADEVRVYEDKAGNRPSNDMPPGLEISTGGGRMLANEERI